MAKLYWFTGLSGAGKTTLGSLWYNYLKSNKNNVVFIDGDMLRYVLDDHGYSNEERKRGAFQCSRLCALLVDQGIDVICCTISMFDDVRNWNRENIHDYCEVYIRATMETLIKRDQKGLYTQGVSNVVGVNLEFEEPKTPDIILDNNGDRTPEEQIQRLIEILN